MPDSSKAVNKRGKGAGPLSSFTLFSLKNKVMDVEVSRREIRKFLTRLSRARKALVEAAMIYETFEIVKIIKRIDELAVKYRWIAKYGLEEKVSQPQSSK